MYTHPGKKLNFMGNDIATIREFDENKELDWFLLDYPLHNAFKTLVKDLSHLYIKYPAFYKYDYDPNYFKWIDADNNEQSIYSYYRFDEDYCFVTVLNMTPNSYTDYQIGVPFAGVYSEVINSEDTKYGGLGNTNPKPIRSKKEPFHKLDNSIKFNIAPFTGIIFRVKLSNDKLEEYYHPELKKEKKRKTNRE